MNNEAFQESTPVGTVVYTLEGYDPEGGNVTFGLIDSGNFMVDPLTGKVSIVKALDREVSGSGADKVLAATIYLVKRLRDKRSLLSSPPWHLITEEDEDANDDADADDYAEE